MCYFQLIWSFLPDLLAYDKANNELECTVTKSNLADTKPGEMGHLLILSSHTDSLEGFLHLSHCYRKSGTLHSVRGTPTAHLQFPIRVSHSQNLVQSLNTENCSQYLIWEYPETKHVLELLEVFYSALFPDSTVVECKVSFCCHQLSSEGMTCLLKECPRACIFLDMLQKSNSLRALVFCGVGHTVNRIWFFIITRKSLFYRY